MKKHLEVLDGQHVIDLLAEVGITEWGDIAETVITPSEIRVTRKLRNADGKFYAVGEPPLREVASEVITVPVVFPRGRGSA